MSRIRSSTTQQAAKSENELELWTTRGAGGDAGALAFRVDAPSQYNNIWWEISDGAIVPVTSGAAINYTPTTPGARCVLKGVPLSQITRLEADTCGLTGWIDLPGLLNRMTGLLYFNLNANSGIQADLTGAALPDTALFPGATGIGGDLGSVISNSGTPSFWNFGDGNSLWYGTLTGLPLPRDMRIFTNVNISIDIGTANHPTNQTSLRVSVCPGVSVSQIPAFGATLFIFQAHTCDFSSAEVDRVLWGLHAIRATVTNATPSANVGGTNQPPTGNVVAPPGGGASNSDWNWNGVKYEPLTGGAVIWDLAKDVNSEGFKKWAITYNGGSL